jgi:hypothetical protein
MLDCYEELRSAQRVVPYLSHGTFASLEFGGGGVQPAVPAALARGGIADPMPPSVP